MNKSKYFHPFIKWKLLIGQVSTDVKQGDYMPNADVQKVVERHHQALAELMVQLEASTLDRTRALMKEIYGKEYLALKRMCPSRYDSTNDYGRGKKQNISDDDVIFFKKEVIRIYSEHQVEPFPYIGKWGG